MWSVKFCDLDDRLREPILARLATASHLRQRKKNEVTPRPWSYYHLEKSYMPGTLFCLFLILIILQWRTSESVSVETLSNVAYIELRWRGWNQQIQKRWKQSDVCSNGQREASRRLSQEYQICFRLRGLQRGSREEKETSPFSLNVKSFLWNSRRWIPTPSPWGLSLVAATCPSPFLYLCLNYISS